MRWSTTTKLIAVGGLLLAGCEYSPARPGGASSQSARTSSSASADNSDRLTAIHAKLIGILMGYQLPARSLPPAHNATAGVDEAINAMMAIASNQGLIFDGSRAADGIVVVGQQGRGGPILMAIAVYPVEGRLAMTDSTHANGLDMAELARMRKRFMDAIF